MAEADASPTSADKMRRPRPPSQPPANPATLSRAAQGVGSLCAALWHGCLQRNESLAATRRLLPSRRQLMRRWRGLTRRFVPLAALSLDVRAGWTTHLRFQDTRRPAGPVGRECGGAAAAAGRQAQIPYLRGPQVCGYRQHSGWPGACRRALLSPRLRLHVKSHIHCMLLCLIACKLAIRLIQDCLCFATVTRSLASGVVNADAQGFLATRAVVSMPCPASTFC